MLEEALEEQEPEVVVVSETKRKGRGIGEARKFLIIQTGVEKTQQATGGVMLHANKKHETTIGNYNIRSERIIAVKI